MCDPLSMGALAMTAASVGANQMGANAQSSARSAATGAEQQRQQQFRKESGDLFDVTLSKANAPTQIAEQAAMAEYRSNKDAGTLDANRGIYGTAGASLDGESKSSIARALSGALTRGKQQAKANAAVNGVGDQTAKMGIELGRAGQWQNIFSNNARYSAALLPGELEAANSAGSTERGIGQILGVGAQAMGGAGMLKGAPTWGDMFGSSTPVVGSSPAGNAVPQGARQVGWFG